MTIAPCRPHHLGIKFSCQKIKQRGKKILWDPKNWTTPSTTSRSDSFGRKKLNQRTVASSRRIARTPRPTPSRTWATSSASTESRTRATVTTPSLSISTARRSDLVRYSVRILIVTSKKSPNAYKSCLKMISLEKWKILKSLQKLPKNVGNLGKIIVDTGFEKLPKVQ